jgi:uncharacterized protein
VTPHIYIGVLMRKIALTLCSLLLAGTALAQQTPSASSSSPSTAPKSAAAAAPPPANPLTDDQAKQMLAMTGAADLKDQLSQGITNYLRVNMPFMPKDVSDDLDQSFQKLDLQTPIIAIYKQHISADDAVAIIAFYKTPAGKDMIQAMPTILQQTQQTGVQLARKTAQEVIERHRTEIQAAAKQYEQEHAPKPAPSLNSPNAEPAPATPAAKPQSN